MKQFLLLAIIFLFAHYNFAQGIRGVVYDDEGNGLPFATIYVQEIETGTSTNQEAYYELQLSPGKYTLLYKFVGYETLEKEIEVEDSYIQLDVRLPKQTLLLDEVTTTAKATDPANWMMRKAIAKSSYHRQQIDAYSGRVYVKGKGKVNTIPFFLRKRFKNEGVDTTTLIITESVSEISYRRPNQFSEKVISVYASKKTDFNGSPMPFIAGSFYQDEIASVISPLSSKAFSYYKFKHLGAFLEGDHLINTIAVIPRVAGPNVFEGKIQLVEEDWALYHVDLNAQVDLGFQVDVRIRQVYQNINQLSWMPITHQFDVEGKAMGVAFEFKYLASVSDYKIELNPALPRNLEILDKEDGMQGKMVKDIINSADGLDNQKDQKVVVKSEDLSAIMNEYKKSQNDSLAKQDIIGVYDYQVDSNAFRQDSIFWAKIRPIPLSNDETRGYRKMDSINVIQDIKAIEDSLKTLKKSTFQPLDILTGGRYDFGDQKDWQFVIYNAILGTQYNTVEGLNFDYSLGIKKSLKVNIDSIQNGVKDVSLYSKPFLLFKPTVRYSVARNTVSAKAFTKYQFKTGSIALRGGRYISQFNDEPAVPPLINTSFSTLWEQNFMKLYEKDFIQLEFENKFSHQLSFSGGIDFEKRYRLLNKSSFRTVDWEREFTPNYPVNVNPVDEFDGQQAFTADVMIKYRPFVKYVIRNGFKRPVFPKSTAFTLAYFKGFKGIAGSEVDFDRIEVGYRDEFDFGGKGRTYFSTKLGGFLNNNSLGFMDYAHFPGNRSFITQADPVQSYRVLDYYLYSTDQYYAQAFLFHRFRRFLVTQFEVTRFMGLKEAAFVNYLYTPDSQNYMEMGYSLGGILKFFRVEVAGGFENFQYTGLGIRIGVSTSIGGRVSVRVETDE